MADTNLRDFVKKTPRKKKRQETVLEMSQAIHLDIISLREPADPDMLVTICGDDVFFITSKKECIKGRHMTKDQLPS